VNASRTIVSPRRDNVRVGLVLAHHRVPGRQRRQPLAGRAHTLPDLRRLPRTTITRFDENFTCGWQSGRPPRGGRSARWRSRSWPRRSARTTGGNGLDGGRRRRVAGRVPMAGPHPFLGDSGKGHARSRDAGEPYAEPSADDRDMEKCLRAGCREGSRAMPDDVAPGSGEDMDNVGVVVSPSDGTTIESASQGLTCREPLARSQAA